MRLWHYELIPYLPRQQLLAQWRELNSIFVKKNRHILINYVYDYETCDLVTYSNYVMGEMLKRKYKFDSKNFDYFFKREHLQIKKGDLLDGIFAGILMPIFPLEYVKKELPERYKTFKNHHNEEYLKICCWNLYEKYIRGQSGFTDEAIEFIKQIIRGENYETI